VTPSPALLAIALVLGLVVLLPARRLQLAGFRGRTIGCYAAFLWVLGFLLAIRPVAARFMIPILVIAYLAPFVVAPARMAGIMARGRGRPVAGRGRPAAATTRPPTARPPMKDVTPPERREGPGGPGAPGDQERPT
jgi:hypothetical protein